MTVTINDVRRTVYQEVIAAVSNAIPGSALRGLSARDDGNIAFDNVSFDTPPPDPMGSEKWVRFSVRHQTRVQYTLGSTGQRRFRHDGVVFCQVFVQTDEATETADLLAQNVADLFDSKTTPVPAVPYITATAVPALTRHNVNGACIELLLNGDTFAFTHTEEMEDEEGFTPAYNNLFSNNVLVFHPDRGYNLAFPSVVGVKRLSDIRLVARLFERQGPFDPNQEGTLQITVPADLLDFSNRELSTTLPVLAGGALPSETAGFTANPNEITVNGEFLPKVPETEDSRGTIIELNLASSTGYTFDSPLGIPDITVLGGLGIALGRAQRITANQIEVRLKRGSEEPPLICRKAAPFVVSANKVIGSNTDLSVNINILPDTEELAEYSSETKIDLAAIGRLHFQAANIRESGVSGDWYMYIVEMPFHYYTTA